MVINIPLQVDEKKMEEVLERDYQGKIIAEISDYIRKTLSDKSNAYYGNSETRATNGMLVLIEERIDIFLKDHRDEIIEQASKLMADKLARSKKGKAILERMEGE